MVQLGQDAIQHPALRPPVQTRIDRGPVPEPLGQAAPFAAMLGDVQDRVEDLQIVERDVPALCPQVSLDVPILSLGEFHGRSIAETGSVVLTGPRLPVSSRTKARSEGIPSRYPPRRARNSCSGGIDGRPVSAYNGAQSCRIRALSDQGSDLPQRMVGGLQIAVGEQRRLEVGSAHYREVLLIEKPLTIAPLNAG